MLTSGFFAIKDWIAQAKFRQPKAFYRSQHTGQEYVSNQTQIESVGGVARKTREFFWVRNWYATIFFSNGACANMP